MSTPSDSGFELDLDLQLLPAWARQPSTANRYSNYAGGEEPARDRRRGDRPFRRDRPRDDQQRPARSGPRPEGRREGGPRGDRPRFDRERREEPRREPEAPLPEVLVSFKPEHKGVELLARQIKLTGRAYPLFQIAALVLRKPDRFEVTFAVKKGAEGQVLQPLFVCSLDETLWLSEEEVAQHVLHHHFDTFYQTEKVATEPPKGTYTLVAQCGMSGAVLGPPNYHDYQTKLRKLHAERFANLPFEVYKSRVKIVRDEAIVKQWIEEQSWKAEYVGLNLPEPMRFPNREAAEKHFRETHLPNLLKSVESYVLPSPETQRFMSRALRTLMRVNLEDQKRFPLKVATVLSQQLAGQGLQFFKVNKTVTHVCVARPHFLDIQNTVVSDGVRKIVEFILAHPGCTRRRILDALAPAPKTPTAPPAPAPAPAAQPVEGAPTAEAAAPAPAAASQPAAPTPTPEQTAVITDLHWLIHQGHVIEFTDGRIETAKKPLPKPPPPPRPEPKKPAQPAATPAAAGPTAASETAAAGVADSGTPDVPAEAPAAAPAEPEPPVAGEVCACEFSPAESTPPPETSPAGETPPAPPAV